MKTERDYQNRAIVDKLGIKRGSVVAFAVETQAVDVALQERILLRTERPAATGDEAVDVVLAVIDKNADACEVLRRWRLRLKPTGGIWLLTPKRDQSGYVKQEELIVAGQQAGVVDNKVCSVSSTTSAMRFVIRKEDRPM